MTFNHYLAVYGTLKQPYGNHALIKQAGLTFIGKDATVDPIYHMSADYGYPTVFKNGLDKIGCEIYGFNDFDEITRIDGLEGHPRWYKREEVPFTIVDSAWIYLQESPNYTGTSSGPELLRSEEDPSIAYWSNI